MPDSLTEEKKTDEQTSSNPFAEFLEGETPSLANPANKPVISNDPPPAGAGNSAAKPSEVKPSESKVTETKTTESKEEEEVEEVEADEKAAEAERLNALIEGIVGKEKVEESKEKPAASEEPKEVPSAKVPRDYSGLTAEEVKVFKKLPNEAFNLLKPVLLEHKKLKEAPATKTDGFYDSEEAVVITPAYKAAASGVAKAEAVSQFWRQQFILARAGKDYKDLTNDDKGNLVIGETKSASPEAEAEILANIQHAAEQESRFRARLEGIAAEHKNTISQRRAQLSQVEEKFFPMYKEPSGNSAKLLEGIGRDLQKLGVAETNPAYRLLQKSAALNFEYQAIIKHLKSGASLQQKQAASGPTESHITGAATSTGKSKTVTMADFEALMKED